MAPGRRISSWERRFGGDMRWILVGSYGRRDPAAETMTLGPAYRTYLS
jgi:hypothetical protein